MRDGSAVLGGFILVILWWMSPFRWLILKWIAGSLGVIAVLILFAPVFLNGLTS